MNDLFHGAFNFLALRFVHDVHGPFSRFVHDVHDSAA
jgi:hypothetical protein